MRLLQRLHQLPVVWQDIVLAGAHGAYVVRGWSICLFLMQPLRS